MTPAVHLKQTFCCMLIFLLLLYISTHTNVYHGAETKYTVVVALELYILGTYVVLLL